MKPPIELAKQYAHELGWKIFPANPVNKHPLISGWQDNASSDLHTIGHFFSKWPNAMIGIPTGKINGITIVDIDIRENKNGFNSIEELGLERLSIYPAVRTPSWLGRRGGGAKVPPEYIQHSTCRPVVRIRLPRGATRAGDTTA